MGAVETPAADARNGGADGSNSNLHSIPTRMMTRTSNSRRRWACARGAMTGTVEAAAGANGCPGVAGPGLRFRLLLPARATLALSINTAPLPK